MLIEQGLKVREAAARLKVGKTALYEALGTPKSAQDRPTAGQREQHAAGSNNPRRSS